MSSHHMDTNMDMETITPMYNPVHSQRYKMIHRWIGIILLPLLWMQWMSGIYHALGIDSSPENQQMLAHTGIGSAFVGMGTYYVYKGWMKKDHLDISSYRFL